MEELIIESYGKVNLALDILYKRDDGYHEISSIMQRINLKDKLIFKDRKEGIIIESNDQRVPRDFTNLVHKAWKTLREITGINRGIHIYIEKNIPIAAGLAGGSSNGAATLQALNTLWDLRLSDRELMDIGVGLGADIPFCIMGGTALAQGIGERLKGISPFSNRHILLCNPDIEISTKYAYSKVDPNGKRLNIEKIIKCIESGDTRCVAENMGNKMEIPIIEEYPIIQDIKDTMIKNGALGAIMSGSGPTVFGIFQCEDDIIKAERELSKQFKRVYICKTL